jgi:phenylacetate-CoA ligase
MKYLPEIEFAPLDKIEKLQFDKLTDLLKYLSHHSPFYSAHFRRNNISIGSIKNLNDLVKIPVTTKNDLQTFNWDFLCIDKNKVAEFTSTSGTLGKPVTIALSLKDIHRLAYNEAISFTCADGREDDLYQLMLTLDRQFMAGLAYYEGIRKLGAGLVRVGPGLPAMQWETIERLKPTVLVAVPSFIVKLLDYAIANNIDFNASSVREIICIGESIRGADLQPNVLAKRIIGLWKVDLYSTYASTEMQTAFTECAHGVGAHHHPELVIIEILNENDEPVNDGEEGEVTITTLGVEAMPLLRYKTGDIARVHKGNCKCGRTTLRLGPIQGRKQYMLKLKGTTLYPPAIFEILNQQTGVLDFVVEASTGNLGTDELKIFVLSNSVFNQNILPQLTEKFQSAIKIVPEIIFVDVGSLERLNGTAMNRKIRKFIDSRKQ